MNATILCVGTELLFGQIVNTNAAWLSRQLQDRGVNVLYHFTVGDNPGRMEAILRRALNETDLIITSGGLGPTQDDLTKEIIAKVMDDALILNEEALNRIESFFRKLGTRMTENNRKQAWLPESAVVFQNDEGTAPGFGLDRGGKLVIALPGPPREMTSMFLKSALPLIESKSEGVIFYKLLRFYGIGESALETALASLIDQQTDPTLATYAKEGECSLRVASRRSTLEEAKEAVAAMQRRIEAIVGQYLFSDADEDLPAVVAKKLTARGMTIATAESCTGGLFSQKLIENAGISAVFQCGFITYSNLSKAQVLGVAEETIAEYGAVSEEVATAMAEGARRQAGTALAVSITGIAGPEGGTVEKPVGTAWICVAWEGGRRTRRITGRDRGRNWNRNYFMLEMMDQVNRFLDEQP